MASFEVTAAAFSLLVILALCEAGRPTLRQFEAPAARHAAANATAALQGFGEDSTAGPCRLRDMSIEQGQTSGVGIPVWQVQIVNVCTNPSCVVSRVVVQCGAFHSATLVNPRVFRRLDARAGTCIVNDGDSIANSQTVTFRYSEIFKQAMTLRSAEVTCW